MKITWHVYSIALSLVMAMVVWGTTLNLRATIYSVLVALILVWLDTRRKEPLTDGRWLFLRSVLVGLITIGIWKLIALGRT